MTEHVGFVKFVNSFLRSQSVKQDFRGKVAQLRNIIKSAKLIAREIEKPQMSLFSGQPEKGPPHHGDAHDRLIIAVASLRHLLNRHPVAAYSTIIRARDPGWVTLAVTGAAARNLRFSRWVWFNVDVGSSRALRAAGTNTYFKYAARAPRPKPRLAE
ncbi:MAG: hypothetical protein WCI05_18410, partial [Myxococcales bacterium]